MRSVDEVFRPILPEPNLVSESPQGYSQSLTVGPQFESQTNLTQTFLRLDCSDDCSRCVNVLRWNIYAHTQKHTWIYKQRSVLPKTQTIDAFLHHVFCYFCIWTEYLALLPDSVISPRAWMKMCFQLITHLISSSEEEQKRFQRKSLTGPLLSVCLFCVYVNVRKSPIQIKRDMHFCQLHSAT